MKYYSTNGKSPEVNLREAVLKGMPEDSGLYMPNSIPVFPKSKIANFKQMTFPETALTVAEKLIGDAIPEAALRNMIEASMTFDAPLIPVEDNVFALELFHGPTLAFKDFAACFMAQLLGYFVASSDQELTILVATSGDTGSAVANGFYKTPGVKVCVLYPSGKVSHLQEQQLTTLGGNITALEVNGTFDDCQNMVKKAFGDGDLKLKYNLTSANSINIARLIPQTFYYFRAFGQLADSDKPLFFSVPSGNFGNLTAGLMAKKMGLPITQFIASTNINDIVPQYLEKGVFDPQASIQTYANAMDVGNPSNFVRILALYNRHWGKIKTDIHGDSYTDDETVEAIAALYSEKKYILDPHGAIGWLGLKDYLKAKSGNNVGVFLETAHPVKFADVVEKAIGQTLPLPEILQDTMNATKQAVPIAGEFNALKGFLMNRANG